MTFRNAALLCGSIAALALVTTGAQAATAAHGDNDIKCLAISMAMASSQDPGAKNVGAQGVTYFLGRIDGHGPRPDLGDRLNAEFKAFHASQPAAQAAAQSCTKVMSDRAADFRAVTQRMAAAAGHPASPAPAPAAPPAATPPAAPAAH